MLQRFVLQVREISWIDSLPREKRSTNSQNNHADMLGRLIDILGRRVQGFEKFFG